jgi:hypothetical protein
MKTYKIVYIIAIIVLLWISISTSIQRFKCVKLTQTELFLMIPDSFVCNFKNCD